MSPVGERHDESAALAETPFERAKERAVAWLTRHGSGFQHLLTLASFLVALWLLHHEFRELKWVTLCENIRQIPLAALIAAVLITALNYVVMVGYDWAGVRMVNQAIPLRRIAVASMISYAFSNSLGTLLGGTPMRIRLYSAYGMTAPEIARLLISITCTFWVGLSLVSGSLFVFAPFRFPERFHLPWETSLPLGAVLLVAGAAFLAVCAWVDGHSSSGVSRIPLPGFKWAMIQVGVSIVDLMLCSAALYVLLPSDIGVGFVQFTSVFLCAIVISLVSHVPGGLGVFELTVVTLLPPSSHPLVASLLAFRLVYYFLPFACAFLGFCVAVVGERRDRFLANRQWIARIVQAIGPRLITGAVFFAGLILLVSGTLPSTEGRMAWLQSWLPLHVVELSHLVGSLVGTQLLILSRGLQRRVDAAWWMTVVLLATGILVSLLKGLDFEEAIFLTVLLMALIPCRRFFYRRGRLLIPTIGTGWVVTLLMTLAVLLWLLLFSYRHIEYGNELWWQFAYHGDAPRSMRGLLASAVVMSAFLVYRLLQSKPSVPRAPTIQEWARIESIVDESPRSNAHLALLGDKRFVFSQNGLAFVMFGCKGDGWIAMGDAVGPEDEAIEATWNFREACDVAGASAAFYQVAEACLGRYVDMGFSLVKIGEEAIVPLRDFDVRGKKRKDLRKTLHNADQKGLSLEIVPRAEVKTILSDLALISEAWLCGKNAAEKSFSLGAFDRDYLERGDVAVVRQAGQLVAFANLWTNRRKEELSIDLMRYFPDAPHGMMEYLITRLMQWGKDEGYSQFNLGMAPLSGVHSHRLGTVWSQLSHRIYLHGEHFYNFQGIRRYKEKFDPNWEARYLAIQHGFALPKVLAQVTSLISGGLIRAVAN